MTDVKEILHLAQELRDAAESNLAPLYNDDFLQAASALQSLVERRAAMETEIEFLRSRRGDLCIERDRARDAIRNAIEAINPADRGGISLDVWNGRLKAATATMQEALNYDNRKARSALPPEAVE